MVNVKMKTKGTMNQSSILSVNVPSPRKVADKSSILALMSPPAESQKRKPANSGNRAVPPQQQSQNPIPPLQNNMQKGQKLPLSSTPLSALDACFGWNVKDNRCDVDVSAFLLGEDGKVIGDSWFVFYGQTKSPDKSTEFIETSGPDREKIHIDFAMLNPDVKKIVFVLTIHEALEHKLHFGMLRDAYVRILDPSGKELVSFMMEDYYDNVISMMIGEVYLHNGTWKFNAVGNGVAKDLAGLCGLYGVEVV